MNQKNKRIIAAAMSLTMLATATPVSPLYNAIQNAVSSTMMQASAADWTALEETALEWAIEEGTLKIKVADGGGTNTDMPDWEDNPTQPWKNSEFTSVEIAEGVTSVGSNAFRKCEGFTSVKIPASVTSINKAAFYVCSALNSVTFADSSKLNTIGEFAFGYTSITDITIPDSVTAIGANAFIHCSSLRDITAPCAVKSNEADWKISIAKVTYKHILGEDSDTCVCDEKMKKCGDNAFYKLVDGVLTIEGTGAIANSAFERNKAIKSVVIGEGITGIGNFAFSNSSLTDITLPDSLKGIGNGAFYGCTNLTTITIPDSVTEIGGNAFLGCTNLSPITAPCTLKSTVGIWKGDCTATVSYNHIIETGETKCACEEASKCGDNACYTLDETTGVLTIYGEGKINNRAFNGKNEIKSVIIGKGITGIGNQTFGNCNSLESVIAVEGSKLATIDDNAFKYCNGIQTMEFPCTVKGNGAKWEASCTTAEVTYTHIFNHNYTSKCDCQACSTIGGKNLYYTLADNKLTIGLVKSDETDENKNAMPDWEWDKAPWNGKEITSVVIEKGVTRIGNCAFPACGVTGSVSIPDSVESIGNQAFYGNSFTSITIPGSVKTIEDNAFTECGALETVTLNEGIEKISENTFGYCSSLEKITIPSSVKTIGDAAFLNCNKLSEITFAGSKPEFLNNPELDQYELDAFSGVNTEENTVITLRYPKDDTTWETFLNGKTGEFDWEGGKFKAEPYLNWNNIDDTALRWAISANGTLYIDKQESPSSNNIKVPPFGENAPWKDSISKIRFVDISSSVIGVSATSFTDFNGQAILVLENGYNGIMPTAPVGTSNYDTFGGGQFIYSKSQLTGASLSLDGQIGVNVSFYVNEDEGSTITIDGETVDLSKCECNNNIYTYTLWVAPKDAYNNIEFKTEKDGTPIVEQTFNVKTDYVDVVLADTEHKDYNIRICDMVTALDTYINSSRVYFGIETDSDKITEINSAIDNIAVTIPGKTGNPEFNETMYYGSSLILDSGVKLRHYIKIENESDIEKIKINVGENEYGSEALTKVYGTDVYYFETDEFNPKDFGTNVSVKCGDTNIIDNYCVLTFIKLALNNEDTKKAELGKICKAIFNFYDTVSD